MDQTADAPRRRDDDHLDADLRLLGHGQCVEVAGLPLEVVTLRRAVDAVCSLVGSGLVHLVATVNVDQALHVRDSAEVRAAFQAATLRYCDGAPLLLLARLVGERLPTRVTGADLLPALCAYAARSGYRVLILGGRPGVPEAAAENLRATHPGLGEITTLSPPLDFQDDPEADAAVLAAVRSARPDVVFVCLGSPKQELWVHRRRAELPPAVYLGVGAAVDFAAGTVERAPRWWRENGLEWLHRLLHDWRRLWRRYLVNDVRFLRVLAEQVVRDRRAGGPRLTTSAVPAPPPAAALRRA